MVDVTVTVRHQDGQPAPFTLIFILDGEEEAAPAVDVPGGVAVLQDVTAPIRYLEVRSTTHGYWSSYAERVSADVEFTLQPLPGIGPLGWWHHLHGVDTGDAGCGRGVRIGVIDEALAHQPSDSCIAHVHNLGYLPARGHDEPRAYQPMWEHGEMVTSLLASSCTSDAGYLGMAPGAAVFFAAAGSSDSQRLPPAYVSNAIDHLVHERGCHLVNVSAGDVAGPRPEIRTAVQDAWDAGALCFFASGNRGPDADILYPARYPECLSVAALGLRDFAPVTAGEWLHDYNSTRDFTDGLYEWTGSSMVGLADCIAAGSNVLWTQDGRPATAVSGTSFACPVAVGVAAVILARDAGWRGMSPGPARAEHAMELLARHCLHPAGPPPEVRGQPAGVRLGMPRAGEAQCAD